MASQNRSEEVSELCVPLLLMGEYITKFYVSLLGVAISYLHWRNLGDNSSIDPCRIFHTLLEQASKASS